MEPASSIIHKLGGEAVVAQSLGTAFTAPYRWQYSKEKGGTDGLIPQKHHPALLALAREQGTDLSAEDFLPPSPHKARASA